MLPKTVGSYGGPYVDAAPVEDPTTQLSSALANRSLEDEAQMTNTAIRAFVVFPAVASGASTPVAGRSVWGAGSGVWPTIARTGVGTYTATYSASYNDGLGVAETVGFIDAQGGIRSVSVFGSVQCTVASNVISIVTLNTAGSAADLTVGTKIAVWAI